MGVATGCRRCNAKNGWEVLRVIRIERVYARLRGNKTLERKQNEGSMREEAIFKPRA